MPSRYAPLRAAEARDSGALLLVLVLVLLVRIVLVCPIL